jgi:hypothetical protein
MCRSVACAASTQRRLDMIDVVEPLGAVQIDDQMHAGAAHALAQCKMIGPIIRRHWSCDFELGFLCFVSSGTWDPKALRRS